MAYGWVMAARPLAARHWLRTASSSARPTKGPVARGRLWSGTGKGAEGSAPCSATAGARQHAVDPRHLGRGELRLDLAAAGSGGLDGGHGRLVALARLLHLRRQRRVGLLGQRPGRPRGRVLGLLQLDQGAEQLGEIVAVHAVLRNLAIADLATPTRPSSSGPRSSSLTISTSATRSTPSRPMCPRSSSAVRRNAGLLVVGEVLFRMGTALAELDRVRPSLMLSPR